MIYQQPKYVAIYEKHEYFIDKVTKKHIEWCKEGLCKILNIETGQTMVEGVWSKN